jgi:hypothetical protein
MPARWDGDVRGGGIGDAAQLVPGASELVAAFSASEWVAENPEIHLRPHIEAWCELDQRLALRDAYTDDRLAYVLDAESATYVRQRRVGGDGGGSPQALRFEVGTGELAPDARFEPHGHVVVINVAGVL